MMKLRMILAARLPLYLLMAGLISMHACKNKKKAAEVTDTEAVKEQIKEELSQDQMIDTAIREEPASAVDEVKPVAKVKALTKAEKLSKSLSEIASATSLDMANASKKKTLSLFSSPEALVLVIIYDDGDEVDYDEPTTIGKYLDYLKDTKSKPAKVEDMVTDEAGKIKELVLRKE